MPKSHCKNRQICRKVIAKTVKIYYNLVMKRQITSKLVKWKQKFNRKPLILNGSRQVGKTYELKWFGKESFHDCHHFDFEKDKDLANIFKQNLDPKRIINELSFYLKKTIDIKNDLVIFDEIQACPEALTSLKYFCDEMPELALCAAGSLLGVHLNSGSYPVGKVDVLTLHPMNFYEFLDALNDKQSLSILNNISLTTKEISLVAHKNLWEQLKRYFIVGGLPEVVNYFCESKKNKTISEIEIFTEVRNMQTNLLGNYFSDIAKHSGKVNAMHIDRVWHSVATQLAVVQDGSVKRFHFKDIVPGIDRYSRLVSAIDWLEHAGLIIKSNIIYQPNLPLMAYTKEAFFKLYMFDIGILGAMCNLSPVTLINYDFGTYKGFFAENFVAQEFLAAGIKELYSWQGANSEIEFLREIDGQIIPIEVKSGNITQAKSLKSYIDKYKPPYSIILSAKNLYIDKIRNVNYYPLYLAYKLPLKNQGEI